MFTPQRVGAAAVAAALLATGSGSITSEAPLLIGSMNRGARTLCLAGALTRRDGGNPSFQALCRQLPGVVFDCRDQCQPTFTIFSKAASLDALVRALDQDHDGDVDRFDAPLKVNIVGYSWGGVEAVEVADAFLRDPRVSVERRAIDNLILIDPFRPLAQVEVPQGVRDVTIHRQTGGARFDCSEHSILGPYVGLQPATCEDERCHQTIYDGAGHCRIVDRAAPAIRRLLPLG